MTGKTEKQYGQNAKPDCEGRKWEIKAKER